MRPGVATDSISGLRVETSEGLANLQRLLKDLSDSAVFLQMGQRS